MPYPNEMPQNLRTEYATVHNGVTREVRSSFIGATSLPLSLVRSLIALPVYQGSDPMVPYQALVLRESTMFFKGFAPWGH